MNRKTRLYPGDRVEGFLLGVGEECISEEYHGRRHLVTQFFVYDERENRSYLDVNFMLVVWAIETPPIEPGPGPGEKTAGRGTQRGVL